MLSLFCLFLSGRIRLAKSFTFLRKVAFFTVVDISITCMIPIVSNTTPHSVNCTSSGNNLKCLSSGTFCFVLFFFGGGLISKEGLLSFLLLYNARVERATKVQQVV